jgi:hypothetical protein
MRRPKIKKSLSFQLNLYTAHSEDNLGSLGLPISQVKAKYYDRSKKFSKQQSEK